MKLELTEQQQQQLRLNGDGPVEVVDPHTKRSYVLIAREQFEKVRSLLDDAPEPSERSENVSTMIEPQMLRSQQAFWRDLPQLLQRRKWRGQWVCYHGDERIGIAKDDCELVQRCLKLGIQRGDFYIGRIKERPTAPWVCEELEESLVEFTDELPSLSNSLESK
jgi:hypothetical protein